jgi:hypothetical protein
MSEDVKKDHNCVEYLDGNCECRICGKVVHDFRDDDDGSYAASGRVATTWCERCGKKERYYSDTGTVIETDFGPEDYV